METIQAWADEVTDSLEIPGKYMMYFEKNRLDPKQHIPSRIENIEPFHKGFKEYTFRV